MAAKFRARGVVAWSISLLAVTGCGRISFDTPPTAGDDTSGADAAERGSFSPITSGCTQADTGPFALVDTFPNSPGGLGYGVYASPPYILMADENGGLNNVRIDNGKFSQLGHLDGDTDEGLGWVEAVWSDGQHVYASSPGRGMFVLDINSDGSLLRLADNKNDMKQARKGWPAGGGLQFVADGNGGVKAVRYNAGALETVGASLPMTSWAQGAWAIGNRVILADVGGLRVADFNGSAYTETVTPDTAYSGYSRLWVDRNDVIFVVHSGGVAAYRINGNKLDELDSFDTNSEARDVWSDGAHVFVATNGSGAYALTFANDHFGLVDHVDNGKRTLGVFGDGKYVYTNSEDDGLRAWSGFTCHEW